MNQRTERHRRLRAMLVFCMALGLPLAGWSFGANGGGEDPAVVPGGSGQIEPGSSLAAKIEKKAMITVITPAGTRELQKPLIVPGGITSQIGQPAPIPWNEVQKIRYQGRATMTGMWVGLGIGAAIGTAAGIAVVTDDDSVYWWSVPLFAAASGAIGAGTGALIGSLFPKWKTLYEAPAKPPMVARLSLAPARRGGAMTLTVAF